MWRVYDNWERLVAAVLKREELRRIALCESYDTYDLTDFSSRFSIDSYLEGVSEGGQVIGCHSVDKWTEHFQKGIDSGKLVVVDFMASWCGPCRFIAPVLAEIAKKTTHVIFLKVDVDELKDVAVEFQVDAMPTFLFLKDGKEVDRLVGAKKEDLQAKVTKHGALTA